MSIDESQRGSAVIEFIVIGLVVIVPMVYVVQCFLAVHSAVLASTQAAREAARAFSMSSTPRSGRLAATAAARLAFADQGLTLPVGALALHCVGECLAPGSAVTVELDWDIALPWLPESWTSDVTIPVGASQRVPIDDYRSAQE